MKILFVAMAESIHAARWISQLADQGWDVHLFPSVDSGAVNIHLENVTVYHTLYTYPRKPLDKSIKQKGFYIPFNPNNLVYDFLYLMGLPFVSKVFKNFNTYRLRRKIKKLKPDLIHSLELQHAGYLTYKALYENLPSLNPFSIAKRLIMKLFKRSPENSSSKQLYAQQRIVGSSITWVLTTWGSDLYLFGRIKKHQELIDRVLSSIDYLSCDCKRDYEIARSLGYKGEILPTPSVSGGFDFDELLKLRQPGLTSDRRMIMLKGYQNWAGRALVGLRALERCADLLQGYTIVLYLCEEPIRLAAELFTHSTGIPVKILEFDPNDHQQIFRHHGQARISMGFSISDGFSVSLLEAAAMGSFPIQSDTSAASEVVIAGKTAFFVPPNDPDKIENAIRKALTDDELVNSAAEENRKILSETFDADKEKEETIKYYKFFMEKH